MKKIILFFATLLTISISAQQQQTINGNVKASYFPFGVGNTNYTIFSSPMRSISTSTNSANNVLRGQKTLIYDDAIYMGKNNAGTGSLSAGIVLTSKLKNINIVADTSSTGYSTNILYHGKNNFKSALSVTSTTATSTSTLNLMSDSGTVAIGYKLRAAKLPLNDSTGLSAGDFYISGNTIKIKR